MFKYLYCDGLISILVQYFVIYYVFIKTKKKKIKKIHNTLIFTHYNYNKYKKIILHIYLFVTKSNNRTYIIVTVIP